MMATSPSERRTAAECNVCGAPPAVADAYCWNCGAAHAGAVAAEPAAEACDVHLVPAAESPAPDRYFLAAVVMGPERFYIAETSPEFDLAGEPAGWERDPALVRARTTLVERLTRGGWRPAAAARSPYGVTLPRFRRGPRRR